MKDIIEELEEIRPYNYNITDDKIKEIAQKAIEEIKNLREKILDLKIELELLENTGGYGI
jgi:hypothetical protein